MKNLILKAFGFSHQEIKIIESIQAARNVQDYLWSDANKHWDFEEWKRMIRKRVIKLEEVSPANPHKNVEIRKRVLQIAAVSINLLVKEEEGLVLDYTDQASNLPQFTKPLDCHGNN